MTRDVLVTGVGLVTPLGADAEETWRAATSGTSGAGPLTRFDPDDHRLRSRIACEVDADLAGGDRVDERNAGRFTRLGVAAATDAVADSGLDPDADAWRPERVGTAIAAGMGGVPEYEAGVEAVAEGGRVSPRVLLRFLPNMAAGHVGIEFDARGPNRAPATACAAGAHAIADAVDDVRLGRADVMLAGGAESAITPTAMGGFDAMRALSTRNDAPTAASRPFDADRDGFVMGEGAGVLVLEAREHVEARGGRAYAAVAGIGVAGDATHPTAPPEDAHGLRRAMRGALDDAGVAPDAIDCVNAHATSTPRGDAHESDAIAATFDDPPPVWAPKGALGHTLGAAGAIEAGLAARIVETGTIPPTLNHGTPDEELAVPVVTERTDAGAGTVVSNAAGFGGTNASLVLTAP